MFGLFKKKSEKEKLQEKYKELMEKAYKASHSDRSLADSLTAKAEEIAEKLKGM